MGRDALADQPLGLAEQQQILERKADGLTARLHLAYSGLRHAFTTRNVHVPDRSVQVALVDGPFSLLDGLWRFVPLPLPAPTGGDSVGCKIEFELRYQFSNAILEAAISPVFDRIANTFVDSFVHRAEQVYGPR